MVNMQWAVARVCRFGDREAGGAGQIAADARAGGALEATLRACNEAATTWAGGVAFEKDVKSNFALRKHTYGEVKARWGLGAQAAQHVIKKTCDAYATLKANLRAGNLGRRGSKRCRRAVEKPVAFRPEGAQPYDDRMLSWQIDRRRISVWTTAGRIKDVAFTASPEQMATLALYRRGESDLLWRDGMWFLNSTCEVPEAPRELNRIRVRERALRTKLQKQNTPSAKRRLKKRRHKEARRAKDINHKIAKHVVAEAGGTSHALKAVGEHRSRDRPGGPHGHPRTGTASQTPTGHPLQLVLRPAGAVHRVQSSQGRGAGGVRRSGVLPYLRRVQARPQGEPGLAGLVRVSVLRIR